MATSHPIIQIDDATTGLLEFESDELSLVAEMFYEMLISLIASEVDHTLNKIIYVIEGRANSIVESAANIDALLEMIIMATGKPKDDVGRPRFDKSAKPWHEPLGCSGVIGLPGTRYLRRHRVVGSHEVIHLLICN